MMIGPERKRAKKRDRPKKAKKRAAKAAAAAREAAARDDEAPSAVGPPSTTGARADTGARAEEVVPPLPGHDGLAPSAASGPRSAGSDQKSLAGSAAATGNPGSVTSAAASATTDGLMAVEPEPTDDPIAVLLAGIDRARDRVDGLLDLAQTLTDPAPADGLPVGRGLGLQLVPDPVPVTDADETPAGPAAEATGAGTTAAPEPTVAPPTASARLVARELLGRGMDAEGVRVRLRDGYGVPDPDAVLAALA